MCRPQSGLDFKSSQVRPIEAVVHGNILQYAAKDLFVSFRHITFTKYILYLLLNM
jgi:hypothetical protein